MMRRSTGLIILLLAGPSWAAAQDPVQVFEGDRVRVTAPDCGLLQEAGTLRSIQGGLLTVEVEGARFECSVESLTRLEVSLGERDWHTDSVRGMRYGLIVGLVAGAAIIAASEPDDGFPVIDALLVTAGGGGVGFLVGTAVGAARDPEDWLDVPLYGPRPAGSFPGVGRVQVGFSIPFGG